MRDVILIAVAVLIGFVGFVVFTLPDTGSSMFSTALDNVGRDCPIKGNISVGSGERIYHLPGQRDYAATTIRPENGERWFCNEDEARAAGWRRAGR